MTTTQNLTTVQPAYTSSGKLHLATFAGSVDGAADRWTLACSGRTLRAYMMRGIDLDGSAGECSKCRKIAEEVAR